MSGNEFRILVIDLSSGKGKVTVEEGRNEWLGGSGLAAILYEKYGNPKASWDDPSQPVIFTIGPLTGYFPLMSKMVCGFTSNYHGQYTESHAGGRAALALSFARLDGVVITGRARELSIIVIGSNSLEIKDGSYLRGMDSLSCGKIIRRIIPKGSGHRSIMRIGPSGEMCSPMACINVDTYRHFGRMGGGAALGNKNIKSIVLLGDSQAAIPSGKEYNRLFNDIYQSVTSSDMMYKYYNLGTPANLRSLNELRALPWRNLQQTHDDNIDHITGKAFADQALLRNGACAGCPVGCIHIGFIRERAKEDSRYHHHQVAYDYEPIFSAGTMLGITNTFDILRILDAMEKVCIDAISAGVALAWATEAAEKGLISEKETLVSLRFGDSENYQRAVHYLGRAENDFYRLLGKGTLKAAAIYGGKDFACVLGQEMAGYATGELFFTAQSLGFRHSHLDTGAYSYDQKVTEKNVEQGVNFLMEDELKRVLLTSLVGCLFARSVYTAETIERCLKSLGYTDIAKNLEAVAERIRTKRWQLRVATGFSPGDISIPRRFYHVKTAKGQIDKTYLDELKTAYGKRIMQLI